MEVAEKTARVAALARRRGLGGVLFASGPGFSWITAGGSNRIDVTREQGAGAVLVTADERRFVLSNNIEAPRLALELPAAFSGEPIQWSWEAERADPQMLASAAFEICRGSAVGADLNMSGLVPMEAEAAGLRTPLTSEEVDRYRCLGRDAGLAMDRALMDSRPGMREIDLTARVAAELHAIGARPFVLLAGADERLRRFRHPIPTTGVWRQTAMVALCAERHGLVVALSRLIHAGKPEDSLIAATGAAASVFSALVRATTPGTTGAALYQIAAEAYTTAGYAGEERCHHQGGAIGYRSREWVAHPASRDLVSLPQAFAWNPSVAGTKVEDTALVTTGGVEMITTSPHWPSLERNGVRCSGILHV